MTTSQLSSRLFPKEHLPYYLFIFVLFAMGLVFGAVMVSALTLDQKQELSRHLNFFLHTVDQGAGFDSAASFQQSLLLHLKWMVLIWVLGLSVIGLPLVFALDFLKGVLVGFSIGYMVGEYSWKGLLLALASVVPQNIIAIPALVVASVASTAFAVSLLKTRVGSKQGALLPAFASFSGTVLLMSVGLTAAALYEGFLSPAVLEWVAPMLLAL